MPTTDPTRSRGVAAPGATPESRRARSPDELLLGVGAGDHQALASLHHHVAGLVHANIRRALHDTTRADTVAEEAFFEVWRQAARFDPNRAPAVIWILDLAHQLAAEHNRYDDARAAVDRARKRSGPTRPTGVDPDRSIGAAAR